MPISHGNSLSRKWIWKKYRRTEEPKLGSILFTEVKLEKVTQEEAMAGIQMPVVVEEGLLAHHNINHIKIFNKIKMITDSIVSSKQINKIILQLFINQD